MKHISYFFKKYYKYIFIPILFLSFVNQTYADFEAIGFGSTIVNGIYTSSGGTPCSNPSWIYGAVEIYYCDTDGYYIGEPGVVNYYYVEDLTGYDVNNIPRLDWTIISGDAPTGYTQFYTPQEDFDYENAIIQIGALFLTGMSTLLFFVFLLWTLIKVLKLV